MEIQPQMYFCRKCDLEMQATDSTCLRCGQAMQTQAQIKSLGGLIIAGGILVAAFGGLGILISLAILLIAKHPPREVSSDAYALLFGCVPVFVFGIVAITRGRRQAKFGKPSKPLSL